MMAITGERFVLRSTGSYCNKATDDVMPTKYDYGIYDGIPPTEDCLAALAIFQQWEGQTAVVGITLGEPLIVREQQHTHRILHLELASWRVAETIPLPIEA
ncbi:MAG TPA: hypothetical protein VLE74_01920 [Candidatus Saccharimonadales bacterium]|nr:hypothetical protein [Candidatus Saccharimonadales bacterium]